MRLALIALLLATPVAPAMAQPESAEPAKLPKDHPDAVRCRRLEVTGSLVRKQRVCKTNAEWLASREQQQGDADDLVTRSRGMGAGMVGG
ncbi:hypothetical protein [Sphingobium lignivorans]|uniref:Secreted protein n=1 Tax=Sphingobium lignivorans TaxID=2735886 RepID=A0ABR6NAF4_9SPHN|nr:hypothetical protein [Sphingobium lignivorans]MBB5984238.1 hypothetical protein [Sphingobium lignivorans]